MVLGHSDLNDQSLNGPSKLLGGLNVLDHRNLLESGTIRRHGIVGVGMALLEKVWPCMNGL